MAQISQQTNFNFTFTTPVKLDRSNYLIWRAQVLASIIGNGLEEFIDGSKVRPPQFLPTREADAASVPNPEFATWRRLDKILMSYVMSSVSLDILSIIVNSSTAFEVWSNLEQHFGTESGAKKVNLMMQINQLKKGSLTVSQYYVKMKSIRDNLALAGYSMKDVEFLTHLIAGLDQPYHPVIVHLEANVGKMALSEAYSMLLSQKSRLMGDSDTICKDVKNYAAHLSQAYNNGQRGKTVHKVEEIMQTEVVLMVTLAILEEDVFKSFVQLNEADYLI